MKSRAALLALAVGAFGIGATEFTRMGLLPVIAKGLDVNTPTAGMLITAYAVGVMVGAPIMTLLLSPYPSTWAPSTWAMHWAQHSAAA